MVRAWHPDVIPILDENRLCGLHSELHIISSVLEKGTYTSWFRHPEVQCFFDCDDQVRWLHDLTVDEMLARGYNHRSELTGGRRPIEPDQWSGLLGYKPSWDDWYGRDMADLYRKWLAEGRFQGYGLPELARRHVKKDGTVKFGQPRRTLTYLERARFQIDRMKSYAERYPPDHFDSREINLLARERASAPA